MPPTVHNSRIEKPEGMSLTWKPRLVKTPTPTMSATTMAVATMAETVVPAPKSRPGHAALSVPDAAMPVHALRATPRDSFIVQAGPVQFKQCYQCFKYRRGFGIIILLRAAKALRHLRDCESKVAGPKSRHDLVLRFAFWKWGVFPGA